MPDHSGDEGFSEEEKALMEIIRKFAEKDNTEGVFKTLLHKTLYLVQEKANQREVDVDFDCYWYRYGTVSPFSQSPMSYFGENQLRQKGESPQFFVPGDNEDEVPSPESEELNDIIEEVVGKTNPYASKKLVRKIYAEQAPYEFQEKFRYDFFRGSLQDLRRQVKGNQSTLADFSSDVNPHKDRVKSSLIDLRTSLPEDAVFEEFNDLFIRFSGYVTDFLNQESDLEEAEVDHLNRLADKVWNTFADGLEIVTRDSLTEEELEIKASDFQSNIQALKEQIQEFELRRLEREEPGEIEDETWSPVVGEYLRREIGE